MGGRILTDDLIVRRLIEPLEHLSLDRNRLARGQKKLRVFLSKFQPLTLDWRLVVIVLVLSRAFSLAG